MTDYKALVAQLDAMDTEEDRGNTWWDNDPSVAWSEPESRHGRLAAIYLAAGWDGCYHNDGAVFHYNVKLRGMDSWRAFHGAIAHLPDARERLEEIANTLHEWELEQWWDGLRDDEGIADTIELSQVINRARFYSCGRSGGYLNCSDLESNGHAMVALAEHCAGSVEYFTSAEYGAYLAEMAIEHYTDRQMAALASPRPDRVEA